MEYSFLFRASSENMPHYAHSLGRPGEPLLNEGLMEGGPGCYWKAGWESLVSQPVGYTLLWLLHQLLSQGSCCLSFPALTSLGDEQWCASVSQVKPFLPILLLPTVFSSQQQKLSITGKLKDIQRIDILYTNKCSTRFTLSRSSVKQNTVR